MRKLLQLLLRRPIIWINERLAGAPQKKGVFDSLNQLYEERRDENNKRLLVASIDLQEGKYIVFSDQHKGNASWADDFHNCCKNYISALQYYHTQGFTFINLGDSEELWKFTATEILQAQAASFITEASFQPNRYIKVFGNHDIIWKNKLDVSMLLNKYFTLPLPVYEGVLLRSEGENKKLDILLTHGHQGDKMSDNNAFSTWLVAHIWVPLQRYLRINPNSPSHDYALRNRHNQMMYQWSSEQKDLLLVTGHTHQPVFASGKYYNHPSNDIATGKPKDQLQPSYFNTGCCCLNDGDITGIEITDGMIRLIKWFGEEGEPQRKVLEEKELLQIIPELS